MSRSLWPYKVVGLARQGKEHPRPIRLDQSKRHSWETTASFFVYFLTSGHSLNGNLYVTRQPPKCFFFQFFFLSSSSFKFIYVPAYLRLDVKRAEQHRSSKIQEEFSLSLSLGLFRHVCSPPCVARVYLAAPVHLLLSCRPVAFTTSCSSFSTQKIFFFFFFSSYLVLIYPYWLPVLYFFLVWFLVPNKKDEKEGNLIFP